MPSDVLMKSLPIRLGNRRFECRFPMTNTHSDGQYVPASALPNALKQLLPHQSALLNPEPSVYLSKRSRYRRRVAASRLCDGTTVHHTCPPTVWPSGVLLSIDPS